MSRKRKQMAVAEVCICATVGCWQWRGFSVCWKQEASAGFWWAAHKEQCLMMDLNFVALITRSRTVLFYQNGEDNRIVLKTSNKCPENPQYFCSGLIFLDSANIKGNPMFYLTLPIK